MLVSTNRKHMYMWQGEELLHRTKWQNFKLTYAREKIKKKMSNLCCRWAWMLSKSNTNSQTKHQKKPERCKVSIHVTLDILFADCFLSILHPVRLSLGEKHRSISGGNLTLHLQWCSCEVLSSATISGPQRAENSLCRLHHCQVTLVSFWRPRSGWLCWWNSWEGRGPCPQRPGSVSQLLGGWHKTWSRTPPGPKNEESYLVSAKEYNWLVTERRPPNMMMSDCTECQGL